MKHMFAYLVAMAMFSFASAETVAPATAASSASRVVVFTLDLGREGEAVVDPNSVGVRGSQSPLNWNTTTPLTRDPVDGLYKATVILDGAGDKLLEFKFVHDRNVWEKTSNRTLDIRADKSAKVIARWNVDSAQEDLFSTIAALDKRLFDAFNARNLDAMQPLFAADLEFFHDKSGLAGFQATMASFAENFKGQARLRRDLVPGTLEVFPVPGYGAMEIGAHRFCQLHDDRPESCATFRFAHVWHQIGAKWQLSRVLSFDH